MTTKSICLAIAVNVIGVFKYTVNAQLKGQVKADGSSTVAPITMAAAELFGAEQPRVRVTVGISGTGGGFKKFLEKKESLRTDINDASRAIKDSERKKAAELGIDIIEIPIAIDGIAVVINPANDFLQFTDPGRIEDKSGNRASKITNWNQIRPEFPDLKLTLVRAGYRQRNLSIISPKTIVGKEKACRNDFTGSEDDNVLVQGVAGEKGGLGYFGFSYYEANHKRLKAVAIDNGSAKPVSPTLDTIRSGEYKPLSRPLFLYVNKASLARPEVKGFP